MPLELFFTICLFLFGLVLGSFLNVVIHRLPRAEHPDGKDTWWVGYGSLSLPRRSQCPHCQHQIPWYENLPLFSWLLLGGKCSNCKKPISARYPAVELLTAVLFLACLSRFGWAYPLVPALTLVFLLIPLTFIDAEHWILPFELTLPGIVFGVLLSVPAGGVGLMPSLIGAAAGFLAFRAMEYLGWLLFKKEALGNSDKYLLALLGAFLGYRPLLGLLFLSSLQGSIFGVLSLLIRGRAGPAMEPASPTAPVSAELEPVAPTDPPEPPSKPSGPDAASGAGGEATTSDAPAADAELAFTFTPAFMEPGLSFARRLALVPHTLLFQSIPDDPPVDEEGDDGQSAEWTPGKTSLPFGPWIALAGLEVLLLTPWLKGAFGHSAFGLTLQMMFGDPR